MDFPNLRGEDIKFYVKKANRIILHANIDEHSIRLIAELPVDEVKYISILNQTVQK